MCACPLPAMVWRAPGNAQRVVHAQATVAELLCSPHPGPCRIAAPRFTGTATSLHRLRGEGRISFWDRAGPDAVNKQPLADAHMRRVRRDAALPALQGSKEVMRPKKTILCVDDNEQALAVRRFLLEIRGYRVVTSTSAHDAIEILRNGGIDLVVSDLIMPQMDGNEMVYRMKEFAPEVPMLLLSGTVKTFDRACHADAFLPKGACSPIELLERVRVMIARKRGPKKAVPRPAFEPSFDDKSYPGAAHPAVAS